MTNTIDVQQVAEKNIGWNFSVNLLDLAFITLGMSLVSRETVLPLLVSKLTTSTLAIGLIPAIYNLGFNLPQLLTANFTERLVRKKPFVSLMGALGERLPYLLMGLAVWWLAEPAPGVALIAFFALLTWSTFAVGISTPAWFDMIAKVIPVRRRGVFTGFGHGLGACLGVVGAIWVGNILQNWAYPHNFVILFLLASLSMAISWVGLVLNREPDSPVVKQPVQLTNYLRRLPTLLRENPNYTRFLISTSTAKLGAMASGFFIVYGAQRFQLGGTEIGALTAALIGGQAVMNLAWGVVGDRYGHKAVLAGAAFALALSVAIAWAAPSYEWLLATFVLLGAYTAGDTTSGLNIALEFCAPEDRPTFIGMTNTLIAPVITLAPLLGGWLALALGYQGMFAVATVFAALGTVLLVVWVREPRVASAG